jgi:hypothetical protein
MCGGLTHSCFTPHPLAHTHTHMHTHSPFSPLPDCAAAAAFLATLAGMNCPSLILAFFSNSTSIADMRAGLTSERIMSARGAPRNLRGGGKGGVEGGEEVRRGGVGGWWA